MTTHTFEIPVTKDQGNTVISITRGYSTETHREQALDQYNRMRAHDGQPPLERLPKGTKVIKSKHETKPRTDHRQ